MGISNPLTKIKSDPNSRNLDPTKSRDPLFCLGGPIWAPALKPPKYGENHFFSKFDKKGTKTILLFSVPQILAENGEISGGPKSAPPGRIVVQKGQAE